MCHSVLRLTEWERHWSIQIGRWVFWRSDRYRWFLYLMLWRLLWLTDLLLCQWRLDLREKTVLWRGSPSTIWLTARSLLLLLNLNRCVTADGWRFWSCMRSSLHDCSLSMRHARLSHCCECNMSSCSIAVVCQWSLHHDFFHKFLTSLIIILASKWDTFGCEVSLYALYGVCCFLDTWRNNCFHCLPIRCLWLLVEYARGNCLKRALS